VLPAIQFCLHDIFIPLTDSSIFENQNKPWRLGWRCTEVRYYHHHFLVRHQKKLWIRVACCVVMMQKPVLCTPLVRHFLPTASIKTLSTPTQNCWFTGWQWRKNSFWRIVSLFKETDNMFLKYDFICLNSLGMQEDDSSTGMTDALFLGHNHKTSFHLLLWT